MDALPFIVFAIRRYCRILFTAKHLKIYSPKVRSNQKLRFCPRTRQGPQAVPSARSRALTQCRGKTRAFDRVPIIPLQYSIRLRRRKRKGCRILTAFGGCAALLAHLWRVRRSSCPPLEGAPLSLPTFGGCAALPFSALRGGLPEGALPSAPGRAGEGPAGASCAILVGNL